MAFVYTGENVQEKPQFKLAPEGDYTIKFVKGEEKISKTGKKMIVLVAEIQHPEYHNLIYEYIVDGENAQQRIYNILSACGIVPRIGQNVTDQTFVGRTANVKIKHEDYNGTPRIKVGFWKRSSSLDVETPDTLIECPTDDALDKIPF